jgi:hypothetical protein
MKLIGIIWEDFVNYKKTSMTLEMPYCTFKCGSQYCQNSSLAAAPIIDIDSQKIIEEYLHNDITNAIVLQGLEPMDSFLEVFDFIALLRHNYCCDDDVVIYTGYNKDEISIQVSELSIFENIIIKYGRYIPNSIERYDDVLGVKLASNNQYAEKL